MRSPQSLPPVRRVEYPNWEIGSHDWTGSEGGSLLFWVTFVLVSACDYLSKNWIRQNFALGESRKILGSFLRFTHWSNSGASFGILQGAAPYLALISVGCIILAILIYPKFKSAGPMGVISLGLIAGGALGNLLDRVRFGSVTDFISLSFFPPIFNVADCAIVTGAVLMAVFFLLTPEGRFEE
ncbi:MAG: signal peptidase II [Bacillota bacterium]|nr:signal peptidase II [Candidatus Fermentithermobacillaceae bacterium]